MFSSRIQAAQAAVTGALALVSHSALAGTAGMIMHEPFATPVPALGGVGLVALAVLLSVVAVRLFKRAGAGGSKFLITAMGVAALASGSGGVKLISDAHAYMFPNINLTIDAGGTVNVPDSMNCYEVVNTTNVQQRITGVNPAAGWDLQSCLMVIELGGGQGGAKVMNGGMTNGGGAFQGTCNDNPGTVLDVGEYCTIFARVLNGG